ncbi:MAG: RimK family protein [Balneolaceae bacterium]
MQKIIILHKKADWPFQTPNIEILSAMEYLTDPKWTTARNVQVFNFCRNMEYQSRGYYVSLLAEARKHRVIPSVTTIQDIKTKSVVKVMSTDLTELIQKSLKRIKSDQFILSVYFGRNLAKQYDKLARELYTLFKTPLLQAKFKYTDRWYLQSLSQISLKEIPEQHHHFVQEVSEAYFKKERYYYQKKDKSIFDLAILHNPGEKSPPSNEKALQKFVAVAQDEEFYVEMITKDDYHRLAEFNALFIRETTAVNHYTYRFSRRAFADGLVVIDDPVSILRCANKVFLAEILNKAKVASPKTMILQQAQPEAIIAKLGLPVVLKLPDSAFSLGVKKAETPEELEILVGLMLKESDLIIAQEFMPTDFDWRIGVLDREILYACKYFMADGHWQIYNWDGKKEDIEGKFESIPVPLVPESIKEAALKVTQLIGNGLYGVDIKLSGGKAYVVEVNDNPNIDAGVEDQILKDELYRRIIRSLKKRIEHGLNMTNGA